MLIPKIFPKKSLHLVDNELFVSWKMTTTKYYIYFLILFLLHVGHTRHLRYVLENVNILICSDSRNKNLSV